MRIILASVLESRNNRNSERKYETVFILSIILVASVLGFAGCELAGDIFKAGVWVGVILVIGIIGALYEL